MSILKTWLDLLPPKGILRAQCDREAVLGILSWSKKMAKPSSIKIKLVSTADTGYYYVTKKNPRTLTEKMVKRKYDPVVRKHVEFKEAKIK